MGYEVANVKFKWNGQTIAHLERNIIEGIFEMAYDIQAESARRAPYLTGALSNSIRVEEDGTTVYVKAGGVVSQSSRGPKLVDYAIKREKGPNRDPSTVHYMKNGAEAILKGDTSHYFKKRS